MKVTLGGDRLGSGNKNKIALRNYERSTHNLSQNWYSSMGVGILYPFLKLVAMRGDKFEIDLEAACRTIPTQGPLFSTYKMQLDVFQCPMRLYQAILHNNPTEIGLKMNQVKLPQLLSQTYKDGNLGAWEFGKFNNSCLLKYLGISGYGIPVSGAGGPLTGRYFNAIPVLAYYDIFKNYYSNKQEQNAYVIGPSEETVPSTLEYIAIPTSTDTTIHTRNSDTEQTETNSVFLRGTEYRIQKLQPGVYYPYGNNYQFILKFDKPTNINDEINETSLSNTQIKFYNPVSGDGHVISMLEILQDYSGSTTKLDTDGYIWLIENGDSANFITDLVDEISEGIYLFQLFDQPVSFTSTEVIENYQLNAFNLKNIDDMRMKVLSHNNLGYAFEINNESSVQAGEWGNGDGTDQTGLPYTILTKRYGATDAHPGRTYNSCPLNGLVVKTYQSDLFNNWIKTEWIDGENGIAAITAVSTASDSFRIDALNLAEKLYNMLNRVAVSGGTYEDWQDAVYTESPRRHLESPIYLGGMSSEVVFEEIVQTAPADGDPLGTLGGRGTLVKRKGGKVTVKVDEASYIIGIVSLTPRIVYTQGNDFDMTDLKTLDDLHKPALDAIGFQNLIGERLAWFDTKLDGTNVIARSTIGKVPAWINYMTAVDKAYGDFAETEGKGFMVLGRNYEPDTTNKTIKDATTYIDPAKYNYVFANANLDAQNFWVQIKCNIKARRLMSAKQIPNI